MGGNVITWSYLHFLIPAFHLRFINGINTPKCLYSRDSRVFFQFDKLAALLHVSANGVMTGPIFICFWGGKGLVALTFMWTAVTDTRRLVGACALSFTYARALLAYVGAGLVEACQVSCELHVQTRALCLLMRGERGRWVGWGALPFMRNSFM